MELDSISVQKQTKNKTWPISSHLGLTFVNNPNVHPGCFKVTFNVGNELVLQFFLPSFSTRVLFQAGVNSCSFAHEDALYALENFPQDRLKEPNW